MQSLSSYVQGRWQEGRGKPAVLVNPATEEPLAELSSEGLDFAGMVRHAREVGGPALRALSFRERGALLAKLSGALHEKREELLDLAVLNGGNTRSDAKFDVDGATGTLMAYASFAERLPETPWIRDGEGVQLGRTARFWGQHVLLPRPGVALHVNAFNFPAWGMMEKLAGAILAGVPVIEKPGTPTALVAWRVARITVESGLLPEGAYQFVAGSLGDTLEQLGPMDHLAFTGSSQTAAKLKAHAAIVRRNARVNVEADSLNAAVLAPEVEPGSETWNLFLRNVVLDMTQKAGQKCTAVRRILVPAERRAQVCEELAEELLRIRVGDPAQSEVRMGPLTSAEQLAEVRAGIGRLSAVARIVRGGADPIADKGYFVAPTLLESAEARRPAFHAEEVFGPVASVLACSGAAEEAAEIVRLGEGGLVASAYADDAKWIGAFVREAGPWTGRLWIAGEKVAEQMLPPGMVLPAMTHGGPGRAGGGEELGAERVLAFYMQRVALQGFKGMLESTFGGSTS